MGMRDVEYESPHPRPETPSPPRRLSGVFSLTLQVECTERECACLRVERPILWTCGSGHTDHARRPIDRARALGDGDDARSARTLRA